MSILIWRYSHFLLALISSLFLIIASVTGGILALEPISESIQSYNITSIKEISLNQTISALRENYDDIIEIEVTKNDFVIASVITDDSQVKKIYINPISGKNIGSVKKQKPFFAFVTNLHRSLFLKTIGRVFVGIISLLLCFITVTGIFLLAKRQGGFIKFFKKIHDKNFNQKFHVIIGRWLVIPILIISSTGVFLSIEKLSLIPKNYLNYNWITKDNDSKQNKSISSFFETISLNELRTLSFPFSKSEEDYFELSLKDRILIVDQFSGQVVKESYYPFIKILTRWNLILHTGKGNILWSIILFIASSSILFFMYTGFSISLKRLFIGKNITKPLKANDCEYIILVGSETGNTFTFANIFFESLVKAGKTVFISPLNDYKKYKKAKNIIIFTSTYGDGEPPSNAGLFEEKFKKLAPIHKINFSVLGFGSLAYPNFCQFAIDVDEILNSNAKFKSILPLYKINEQSYNSFYRWVTKWSKANSIDLIIDINNSEQKGLVKNNMN